MKSILLLSIILSLSCFSKEMLTLATDSPAKVNRVKSCDSSSSLELFSKLGKLAKAITKVASEADVTAILGDPLSKGTGGWMNLDRKIWNYMSYTDDQLHRSFSVSFDPKDGCSVSQPEISRSEIEKKPLNVTIGTVAGVYLSYPDKGGKGFLYHVDFKHNGRIVKAGLAVETLNRVKGIPEVGSEVRVEHYYDHPAMFVFRGLSSL